MHPSPVLSCNGCLKSTHFCFLQYLHNIFTQKTPSSPVCREHFHCLECHRKIFIKKEEMIRHFKWHKKRDESLQHGFMRYSPGDDCGDRYHNCQHNRKQTHYHCIQVSYMRNKLCSEYNKTTIKEVFLAKFLIKYFFIFS